MKETELNNYKTSLEFIYQHIESSGIRVKKFIKHKNDGTIYRHLLENYRIKPENKVINLEIDIDKRLRNSFSEYYV
jgi:hypothetical protein